MKEMFFSFYRPSNEELSKLWNGGTFILDANVLLNLYRYPKEARNDLLKILRKLSDRLWIPHQAALEYQENRLSVIAEQVRRYGEVRKVLENARGKLRADLGDLQLRKRHSLINADTFLERVDRVFDDFLGELEALEQAQPDVFDDDELRDEIDSLLKGKVGASPESQEELDRIYEEGKIRYKQKLPPGYMDVEKSNDAEEEAYLYGGLYFEKEYGDLILWYEIIKEAQGREEFKQIIFVTDDDKEDWWWKARSKGWKTIGPRPELIEEISQKAGVSTFYMYNSERFMRLAAKHLGIEIRSESVDQVRAIARLRSIERDKRGYRREMLQEVLRASDVDSVDVYLRSDNEHILVKSDIDDGLAVGAIYVIDEANTDRSILEVTIYEAANSYWQPKIDAGYRSLPRAIAEAARDERLPALLSTLRRTAQALRADGMNGAADAIASALTQAAA